MKTFKDISMYNGQNGVACVIGVDNFAIDVSGSSAFRRGERWIQELCGQVLEHNTDLLYRISCFRIMGKLASAAPKYHLKSSKS